MSGNGLPKLLFVGRGRSGKGEAGLWFAKHTNCVYAGSLSWVNADKIAADLGVSVEQAYAERHQNRNYWRAWLDKYREGDESRLCRDALEKGNITDGTRALAELKAVRAGKMFDLIIWIERAEAPHDPTLEFGPEGADVVINNNDSLEAYHERLERFARTLRGVTLLT